MLVLRVWATEDALDLRAQVLGLLPEVSQMGRLVQGRELGGGLWSSLGGRLAGLGGRERQGNRVLGEPPAGAPEGPGSGCWRSRQAAGWRQGAASWCSPAVSPAAASAQAPQPPERPCPLRSLPVDRFTFPALEEDVIYDDVPCENLDAHQPGTPPPCFPADFRARARVRWGGGGAGPGRVCSCSFAAPPHPAIPLPLAFANHRRRPGSGWSLLGAWPGPAGGAGTAWLRGPPGCRDCPLPRVRGPGQSFYLPKTAFPVSGEPGGSPGFPGLLGEKVQLVKPDRWGREDCLHPALGPGGWEIVAVGG